jgi:hypothetical protein
MWAGIRVSAAERGNLDKHVKNAPRILAATQVDVKQEFKKNLRVCKVLHTPGQPRDSGWERESERADAVQ